MQKQVKSSSEEGSIIFGCKLFQQIFYKYHVWHTTKDKVTHGQKQNFLSTDIITHGLCVRKIKHMIVINSVWWWRERNKKLGGIGTGLMKEERGFHCFPRLGHSSGNGREQTPLLAVLQKVARPQKGCPGTPRVQILVFLKSPISNMGWRMAKLFLQGGPNHGAVKGTKVFRKPRHP